MEPAHFWLTHLHQQTTLGTKYSCDVPATGASDDYTVGYAGMQCLSSIDITLQTTQHQKVCCHCCTCQDDVTAQHDVGLR